MSVLPSDWPLEFEPGTPRQLHDAGAFAGDITFASQQKPHLYEVKGDPGEAEEPKDEDPEAIVLYWRPVSIGPDGKITRLAS